jgi:hypothetical protein
MKTKKKRRRKKKEEREKKNEKKRKRKKQDLILLTGYGGSWPDPGIVSQSRISARRHLPVYIILGLPGPVCRR